MILFGNLKWGSHSYTLIWNQLRALLQHKMGSTTVYVVSDCAATFKCSVSHSCVTKTDSDQHGNNNDAFLKQIKIDWNAKNVAFVFKCT